MKCRWLLLASCIVLASMPLAVAQQRVEERSETSRKSDEIRLTTQQVQSTPEMWFYQQEQQRYENPKDAVRRNAEYRANQREWRIAMMKAQGLSKMRPETNHTPFFNTYLPTQDPYRWNYGRGVMDVYAPTDGPFRR